jgi:hypothetical protein
MSHYESSATVAAPADRVFAHIDDYARLSSHMNKSSWMMGGGKMTLDLDDARGQQVGSRIRMAGRVFGIQLALEEIVTERVPPHRKTWETVGSPRLLVIGSYTMGFDLLPQPGGSLLRVFIDYALPEKAPMRWLGHLFGRYYAKWCTQKMVGDAVKHFALGTDHALWLRTLRRYLAFALLANLAWEFAHLPLYTIWKTASPVELASAAAHCTLGDMIIAAMALVLGVLLVGDSRWPQARYLEVAAVTTGAGVVYTIFSEWLNLVVQANWAYAPEMPVIPLLGIGLSPLLQWLLIPPLALWIAGRGGAAKS